MGFVASREEITVVTCPVRKAGLEPRIIGRSRAEMLDDECARLCTMYGLSDWLVTTSTTPYGWVASAVLTIVKDGEQTVVVAVASRPLPCVEDAEYQLLGRLFIVGEREEA